MTDFFEKKFMDEMEKKSATTALLLYGATKPVERTKKDLKEHLEKIAHVGLVIIDEMDRHLYEVASQSGGLDDYCITSEKNFYNKTLDKLCCMTEIYTQTDLNHFREIFSVDENNLYAYDTRHDSRMAMEWSFKKLILLHLGFFEAKLFIENH